VAELLYLSTLVRGHPLTPATTLIWRVQRLPCDLQGFKGKCISGCALPVVQRQLASMRRALCCGNTTR
jgi:hypothetical protein